MLTFVDSFGEGVVQLGEESVEGALQSGKKLLRHCIFAGPVHGQYGRLRGRPAVRVDDRLVLRQMREHLHHRSLQYRFHFVHLSGDHRLKLLPDEIHAPLLQGTSLVLKLGADRRLQLGDRLETEK